MATIPAKQVTWRSVESSNVDKVGWLPEGMVIIFKNGSSYLYRGVSRQRAVACAYAVRLSGLASVGKYLNRRIKPYFEAIKIS